jgi:glycopeptide antibiotics resistance protein
MKFLRYFAATNYVLLLLYAVFFGRRRIEMHQRHINLVPVKNLFAGFLAMDPRVPHEAFNFYSNLFGNMLLFLPLPFVLAGYCRIRKHHEVLLAVFFFSCVIEILQYIFVLGVSDIDDVLLNVLGAEIGYRILRWNSQAWKQTGLTKETA